MPAILFDSPENLKLTRFFSAPIAQMVEQRTLNPLVQGSSPCWGTP